MPQKHIVVIGAGSGGEAAAKRAIQRGARVTLVEKSDLGGLCLNRGCIPSKTLLESGRLLRLLRAAGDVFDGADGVRIRWERLQAKKDAVVASLRDALGQRLKRLGVTVLNGEARFADDRALEAAAAGKTERLAFDAAVIATGSRPFFPAPFDALRNDVLDSDRALALKKLPESVLIVGGGAVGCEFACLFREFGAAVTVIEMTATLLPGEDAGVVRVLRDSFETRGIRVWTDATVTKAERRNDGWSCALSDGAVVSAQHLLVCVGRRPALENLALEKAKIDASNGRIAVDEFLRTSRPSVYAVGDVNNLSLLAHAAAAQAEVAVDHILGGDRPYAHHLVPRCLYTWPEVASVGEWTHTAEAKGVAVKTQRFFFQGSPKALAGNETEGFIQVVSKKTNGRLLGAQIIGPHATELIHVFSVALSAGLTAEQLRAVIFAHPTLSEGVREALSR